MIANTLFAAGAFASLVAAIPMAQVQHQKRDIVWETHTEIAVTTIPVTVTSWLQPGESAPTDAPVGKQHYGHKGHGHGHGGHGGYGSPPAQPATTETSAPAAPATSSESVPVAPAPSSYEQPPPAYTSQAAPAAPTTTQTPAPQPTSTWEAPSAPAYTPPAQTSAAPSYDSGSSAPANGLSGMAAAGKSYSGDITYWTPALGACGWTNSESEPVVAIAESLFDMYTPTTGIHAGNPNMNALCGKYVSITGADGAPTKAKIVDRCGGCEQTDLDLSPTLFQTVYPAGDGRVHGVEWMFD